MSKPPESGDIKAVATRLSRLKKGTNMYKNTPFQILRDLSNIDKGETKKKRLLKSFVPHSTKENFASEFESRLRKLYFRAVSEMRSENILAHQKTSYELAFEKKIKSITKKRYVTSVLVGRHVLDGFFPQHKIFVEIDGGIHNVEFKQKKDSTRDQNIITKLRCSIVVINNDEISKGEQLFANLFQQKPRLSTTTVNTMWRDLYIFTVLQNYSLDEISKHFEIPLQLILQKLNPTKTNKATTKIVLTKPQ